MAFFEDDFRFRGNLGTARVTMQIDVGFGDAVVPGPVDEIPVAGDGAADLATRQAYVCEAVAVEFERAVERVVATARAVAAAFPEGGR